MKKISFAVLALAAVFAGTAFSQTDSLSEPDASNIGNDSEATHTSFGDITRERHELPLPLTAPSIVAPDYHFDKMFDANENRLPTMLARIMPHTLKGYIKRLIKR